MRPYLFASMLAILMLVQAAMVSYMHSSRKWTRTAHALTNHIRIAWLLLLLIVLGSLAYFGPSSSPATEDATTLLALLNGERTLLLFALLTFFAVTAQFARQYSVEMLLTDTAPGRRVRSAVERFILSVLGGRDPWLAWLTWGLVTTVMQRYYLRTPTADTATAGITKWFDSNPRVFAVLVCVSAALLYFFWVLSSIRRRLVNEDRFRGPIVATFARSPAREVPVQTPLLGPRQSGKSFLYNNLLGLAVNQGGLGTSPNSMRIGHARREAVRLSAIDLPGESLGSHIASVSRFRADLVVLVIRVKALDTNSAAIDTPGNFVTLETFVSKCVTGSTTEATATREYLAAFRLATNFTQDETARFNVQKALVLFNFCAADPTESEMARRLQKHDGTGLLARYVASCFQIDATCCTALIGDASHNHVTAAIYERAAADCN